MEKSTQINDISACVLSCLHYKRSGASSAVATLGHAVFVPCNGEKCNHRDTEGTEACLACRAALRIKKKHGSGNEKQIPSPLLA